jgi:hypothetical protein
MVKLTDSNESFVSKATGTRHDRLVIMSIRTDIKTAQSDSRSLDWAGS